MSGTANLHHEISNVHYFGIHLIASFLRLVFDHYVNRSLFYFRMKRRPVAPTTGHMPILLLYCRGEHVLHEIMLVALASVDWVKLGSYVPALLFIEVVATLLRMT